MPRISLGHFSSRFIYGLASRDCFFHAMQYDYAKEGLLVVTVSSKLGNGAVVGDIVDFLKQIQIKSKIFFHTA